MRVVIVTWKLSTYAGAVPAFMESFNAPAECVSSKSSEWISAPFTIAATGGVNLLVQHWSCNALYWSCKAALGAVRPCIGAVMPYIGA